MVVVEMKNKIGFERQETYLTSPESNKRPENSNECRPGSDVSLDSVLDRTPIDTQVNIQTLSSSDF